MGYQTVPHGSLDPSVDCISSCNDHDHLLKAQHCSVSPNWCFTPPLAPHTPTPYRLNITGTEKLSQKPAAFKCIASV